MRAQGWLPGRKIDVFSDGDVGLKGIVLSATRQPVTHILDWCHLSMRLRHIEQAWEGLRHVDDLNIYLQGVSVDVPRFAALMAEGRSYRWIARGLGISKNTVADIAKRQQLRT